MSLKLLKSIKQNYLLNGSKLPAVTTGKIEHDAESIFLIKNGIPSSIIIQYTGAVYFQSVMSPLIKIRFNKNAIFIFNFFRIDFSEQIFAYSGDLKITNCTVMSFNQSSFYPTIVDKIGDDKTNTTKTKFEDDSIILHDTSLKKIPTTGNLSTGLSVQPISSNKFNNIQKYGKVERQEIATVAFKTASLISRPKPAVTKPTISKPVVTKPTIARPTVSKPIKKPKGGKY